MALRLDGDLLVEGSSQFVVGWIQVISVTAGLYTEETSISNVLSDTAVSGGQCLRPAMSACSMRFIYRYRQEVACLRFDRRSWAVQPTD